MAKTNTKAQAQVQAQETKAKRITTADLAKQIATLTEAVTNLTALVAAQAAVQVQAPAKEAAPAKQEKAPKGKKGAKAKADAKAPKLPKPSFEEWSEYKKSHWFVVANDPECPTKHDKNSKLYRLFLKARKEGKA